MSIVAFIKAEFIHQYLSADLPHGQLPAKGISNFNLSLADQKDYGHFLG
jgi:hypothetical protein